MKLRNLGTVVVAFGIGISLIGCKKEGPPPPPAAPAVPEKPAAVAPAMVAVPAGPTRVEMSVTEEGFVPGQIAAKAGIPLVLAITRKTDKTCATEILFQGSETKMDLPLNKMVEVTYTPKVAGTVKFGCAMGMMIAGVVTVTD
jgi:hypothetical protein